MQMRVITPGAETAPLLQPWRGLAPLIVRLIAVQPPLAARLLTAPPRAMHAVAAFMQARVAGGAGDDHAGLATEIARRHPRDMLAEALGGTHPRLYRALDRCGGSVWPLGTYRDLLEVLHGPLGSAVLGQQGIYPPMMRMLSDAARDPVLVAAGRVLLEEPGLLDDLRSALVLLRRLGVARRIECLPCGAGRAAILRRIEEDLRRARPPKPEFAAPPGWRHLRAVNEVLGVGRTLGNCLTDLTFGNTYIAKFLKGDLAMLTTTGVSAGLIAVERVGPGLWHVSESHIRARTDERLRTVEKVKHDLRIALAEVGAELTVRDPMTAIRNMADRGCDLTFAED